MSALQKQILRNKLPPMSGRGLMDSGLSARKGFARKRDYTPQSWNKYFETSKEITVSNGNTFKVYSLGNSGPLLLLLHGGGYSALTWSLFVSSIHELVVCQVAAVDLRGHGESRTADDSDLSAETLSEDIGNILSTMYQDVDVPPVILVGHSMGGAIAVHTVYRDLIPSIIGVVVIDVVEGTAMDSLQSMQSFLRSRPASFQSLENAIEWCVRSGQVRNLESAKVSMPGQLRSTANNNPATYDVHTQAVSQQTEQQLPSQSSPKKGIRGNSGFSIPEEEEETKEAEDNSNQKSCDNVDQKSDNGVFKQPGLPTTSNSQYTWRIDLSKTEKFWNHWFEGLSNMFLSSSVPKLLLLAGVDRLDKELTIGQMQGKFQMQVLPQCGHAVHEDVPDKVAEAVATFMIRHKFAEPASDFQRTFPAC